MRLPKDRKGRVITGGGRKDLTDRARYFLALQAKHLTDRWASVAIKDTSILFALNYLIAGTGALDPQRLQCIERMAAAGKAIYIDSGCFTLAFDHAKRNGRSPIEVFMSSPATLPFFEEWLRAYMTALPLLAPHAWGYVEVDFGTYEERKVTRQRVYDEAGLVPIPVYRVGQDPFSVFEDLLRTYDRVCIAGTVRSTRNERATVYSALFNAWQSINPECFVHALGVGAFGAFSGFNFPSCDSSTYANAPRYGLTCGYCYAGFSHAAHFSPKFALESGGGEAEVSSLFGQSIGILQHSIYNLGRREVVATLREVAAEYTTTPYRKR